MIVDKLGEALEKQEFKRVDAEPEDGVRMQVFAGENLAYAVMYTLKTKRIELKTCAMTDDGPDKNWKSISSWLYDPQEGEDADVESIVNDFCETVEGPKRVIGTNTIDCMKSGIVYGNAAMIDGIIERVSQELGEKPTVVATGGLAPNITKYCKSDIICDGELILKGLRILYNKNKP